MAIEGSYSWMIDVVVGVSQSRVKVSALETFALIITECLLLGSIIFSISRVSSNVPVIIIIIIIILGRIPDFTILRALGVQRNTFKIGF
jgi:hypothetical protein